VIYGYDIDDCDSYSLLRILQYLLPCRVRRSSGGKGWHVESRVDLRHVFDDPMRQALRETHGADILFEVRIKPTGTVQRRRRSVVRAIKRGNAFYAEYRAGRWSPFFNTLNEAITWLLPNTENWRYPKNGRK